MRRTIAVIVALTGWLGAPGAAAPTDVGIIALSVAPAPALTSGGVHVEIPPAWHPPIRQGAVVVRAAKNQKLARDFLAFFKQPDSLKLLADFGFAVRRP